MEFEHLVSPGVMFFASGFWFGKLGDEVSEPAAQFLRKRWVSALDRRLTSGDGFRPVARLKVSLDGERQRSTTQLREYGFALNHGVEIRQGLGGPPEL